MKHAFSWMKRIIRLLAHLICKLGKVVIRQRCEEILDHEEVKQFYEESENKTHKQN